MVARRLCVGAMTRSFVGADLVSAREQGNSYGCKTAGTISVPAV